MIRLLKLAGATALILMLAGCQESLQQLNRDLANANAALAANKNGAMAKPPNATRSGQEQPTQLTVPTDPHTREAMEAALPTIKKVLAIHQCVKNWESLRQLNIYAVPGVDMARVTDPRWSFPNANNSGMGVALKYHDLNKCVDVRAIDQWTMPALNALNFRVVYFATDSGETVNFNYYFSKIDDGSWKIARMCSGYGC